MKITYRNILLTLSCVALNFNLLLADNAKEQTSKTVKLLELVAQSINNDSIKIANKNNAINYLLKYRDKLEETLVSNIDDAQVAHINKTVLLDLIEKFNNKLSPEILSAPNRFQKITDTRTIRVALTKNISINDHLMQKLVQKVIVLDKNFLNKLMSDISEFAIKHNLDFISTKIFQYSGIATYIIAITPTKILEDTFGPHSIIVKLKSFLGAFLESLPIQESQVNESIDRTIVTKTVTNQGISTIEDIEVRHPDAISKITRNALHPTGSHKKGELGVISTLQAFCKTYDIVEFVKAPMFKLTPCVIFSKWLGEDFITCNKKISKQLAKLNAYAQGKKYDSSGELKDASNKMAFDKLIGYETEKAQLRSAIIYAENKDLFDLAEETPNRGYLISGPLDAAKHLASGLAYEIDNAVKKSGKQCKVMTLSASKMIADKIKLTDKIKELEKDLKNDFVVLVIENLHNAIAHSKIDSAFWSELIDGINSVTNGTKKRFFVVATTNELNPVLTAVQGAGCLENSIRLSMPNKEQREEFIKNQLSKRLVNANQEVVANLVNATENLTFSDIESRIKKSVLSFSNATRAINQLALK